MSTKHLVDPELAPLLALIGDGTPLSEIPPILDVPQQLPPSSVDIQEIWMPGPDGAPDLRALLYAPQHMHEPRAAILHIHGGGYVIGKPEPYAPLNIRIVEEFEAVVLSVDYRLAPATKFPGNIEDCYAALAWLHTHASELNIATEHIGVMGDSAGGGLAAALTLLARDRGKYKLAFQHLTYPMLDDRTAVDSDHLPFAGEFMWTRESNRYGWESLLDCAPGSAHVSCYAAAARAEDLSGLPRTFIACGALDLFVEENIDYARRLIRAGVPTELHVYPGAPHGFSVVDDASVTRQAFADAFAFLARSIAI